ncbi:hypothetical protein GDO81_008318 [Engystomops pustulosus]|uniref:Uncharacterized protein n=1 Tax=Engystomops pustulosus TaxID=76066 RepID=A0AAV7CFU6_ENGPU|nr:hypothetical protein GDO81_008318 [Engystomops pustulosus]
MLMKNLIFIRPRTAPLQGLKCKKYANNNLDHWKVLKTYGAPLLPNCAHLLCTGGSHAGEWEEDRRSVCNRWIPSCRVCSCCKSSVKIMLMMKPGIPLSTGIS